MGIEMSEWEEERETAHTHMHANRQDKQPNQANRISPSPYLLLSV
jgi:hypothetical protein